MHQGPPVTSLGTVFTHRNHLLPGMYQFETNVLSKGEAEGHIKQ